MELDISKCITKAICESKIPSPSEVVKIPKIWFIYCLEAIFKSSIDAKV